MSIDDSAFKDKSPSECYKLALIWVLEKEIDTLELVQSWLPNNTTATFNEIESAIDECRLELTELKKEDN